MSDPIIEAMARTIYEHDTDRDAYDWNYAGEPERNKARKLAIAVRAVVTPLIRAAIQLEATATAARELHLSPEQTAILIAAAIRTLKQEPSL
jgi:hypothetical protein